MALRSDQRRKDRPDKPRPDKGKFLIFGRPTLTWEGAPSPEEYYKSAFGYSEVHSLDVSDYEGATFVHNLNDRTLPAELVGQYDYVSMGGTAEHIFNVGNALWKAAELLKVGGTVICSGPANNWLDHGFYQLCPTLKFDYFQQNGFELGTSIATLFRPDEDNFRRIIPLYPGEAWTLNYVPARISHTLRATKLAASTSDVLPLQSIYRVKHNNDSIAWRLRAAAPYDVDNGVRSTPPGHRVKLETEKMTQVDGAGPAAIWAHPYSFPGQPGASAERPFRSRALVYERNRLLTWIVSDNSMVGEKRSSFHHGEGFIYFSTSDGSDPRSNKREYEVFYPEAFDGLNAYGAAERAPGALGKVWRKLRPAK